MSGKVIPLPLAAPALDKKKGKSKPPPMRLFVGISPPDSWRVAAESLMEHPAEALGVRPTPWDNLHLTLVFLGDVEWGRSNPIARALGTIAFTCEPFALRMAAPGAFPDMQRPRVLWLGVEPSEELTRLQDGVATVLETMGFRRDARDFHPHLTLAYLKGLPHPGPMGELRASFAEFEPPAEPWVVDRLLLFRSFLEDDGARYQALSELPLGHDDSV